MSNKNAEIETLTELLARARNITKCLKDDALLAAIDSRHQEVRGSIECAIVGTAINKLSDLAPFVPFDASPETKLAMAHVYVFCADSRNEIEQGGAYIEHDDYSSRCNKIVHEAGKLVEIIEVCVKAAKFSALREPVKGRAAK